MSKEPKDNHIRVAIVTTAGTFPAEGYDDVPSHQPVKIQLEHAARQLGITSTADWIATAGDPARELDVKANYIENRLAGQVDINWGPSQRGGGVTA